LQTVPPSATEAAKRRVAWPATASKANLIGAPPTADDT